MSPCQQTNTSCTPELFFRSKYLVTMQIHLINNAIIGNNYLYVNNLYNKPSTQPSPAFVEL